MTTVLSTPPEGAPPVSNPMASGPGLFQVTRANGEKLITNVRRLAGFRSAPGRGLINTAAALLGLLDAGLFAVSLAAQYQYIFHAKHQHWPAVIEAVALDAGVVIFSLLALGLARGRQSAPVERALIVVCALGSAAMNYGAADVSSPRSVAAYVMPPVFLAIVTDRVIATVRRHMLGMEAERSAWAVIGRAILAAAAGAGRVVLYMLRLVLAPRSTLSGARSLVLLATPLPGAHALVQERAQVDAARAALGTVRSAIDDDLRELRNRHEQTAAHADESLRATREAARTQAEAVREAASTEIAAVREAAALAPRAAREAVSAGLRDLREQHETTAETLRAAQQAWRTDTDAVRETIRTEIGAVREALRAQTRSARDSENQHGPVPTAAEPGAPNAPEPDGTVPPSAPARRSDAELSREAETRFAAMVADREVPSLRQIKDELHVSQYRARKVHDHLAAVTAADSEPRAQVPGGPVPERHPS